MGLEINTKEELLNFIKELGSLGLNEVNVKMGDIELSIKNNNPIRPYTLTKEQTEALKKDDSKASAAQILEIFSKDIEELHTDAR